MHFYDKNQNPMDVEKIIAHGKLFLIAELSTHTCSTTCVGLFLEDDDNYFLMAIFDSLWLADLVRVAENAKKAFQPEDR